MYPPHQCYLWLWIWLTEKHVLQLNPRPSPSLHDPYGYIRDSEKKSFSWVLGYNNGMFLKCSFSGWVLKQIYGIFLKMLFFFLSSRTKVRMSTSVTLFVAGLLPTPWNCFVTWGKCAYCCISLQSVCTREIDSVSNLDWVYKILQNHFDIECVQ